LLTFYSFSNYGFGTGKLWMVQSRGGLFFPQYGELAVKRSVLRLAVLALLCGGAGEARAGQILDLEDWSGKSNTPFSLLFIAGSKSTTLSFAGYQVPANEQVTHIGLTATGGSTNLLGSHWTFTPASSGSTAFTLKDGTSVPGLLFEGAVEGSFDTFSQTVSTSVGQSYTLSFLFENGSPNAPGELVVSASGIKVLDPQVAAPEPASLTLCGLGAIGLLGYGWRRKTETASAA
jgi:hypothetical protein